MRLGMKREAGQVCSAFGLGKGFYSEVFLLLSGLVVGNGTGVMFQCCEIRDNSLDTWLSLPEGRRGIPVLKVETEGELQWLCAIAPPPPPQETARTDSLVSKFWDGLSKTEGQGANITIHTEKNKLIKQRAGQNVERAETAGQGLEKTGHVLGKS